MKNKHSESKIINASLKMSTISLSKSMMTREEACVDVRDSIDADFWNCYTCDLKGTIVKVLYDARKVYREGMWNYKQTNDELYKQRDEIRTDVDKILRECEKKNTALCISLGCDEFKNFHFYPNTDGTFERIEVNITKE